MKKEETKNASILGKTTLKKGSKLFNYLTIKTIPGSELNQYFSGSKSNTAEFMQ